MQETLSIYLHTSNLLQPSWAVIDSNGHVRQNAMYDDPNGLAQIAADKKIVVIVPAEDILLLKVLLPKTNHMRLRKALPFALEEQLINDVDELHFAIGSFQTNGELPVAIVTRECMQKWFALLKEWEIQPDILIPSSLTISFNSPRWGMIIDDLIVVRTGFYYGFAADRATLKVLLNSAMKELGEPLGIDIKNYTNSSLALPDNFQEDFVAPEELIVDLAKNLHHGIAINLLQNEYAVKKPKLWLKNSIWKITASLLVVWLSLLLLYPIVSYFILQSQLQRLEQQITVVYQKHFPKTTTIKTAQLEMQEKLQKLKAGNDDNRFLSLIAYVSKAWQQVPGLMIQRIDFQDQRLTMTLDAKSAHDFSLFTKFLSQQGLYVRQQNIGLLGDQIQAVLVIG